MVTSAPRHLRSTIGSTPSSSHNFPASGAVSGGVAEMYGAACSAASCALSAVSCACCTLPAMISTCLLLEMSSVSPKFAATWLVVMLPALIFDASTLSAASSAVVIAPAAISLAVMLLAAILSAVTERATRTEPEMALWYSSCESCSAVSPSSVALMATNRPSGPLSSSLSTESVPALITSALSDTILASVIEPSAICAVPTAPVAISAVVIAPSAILAVSMAPFSIFALVIVPSVICAPSITASPISTWAISATAAVRLAMFAQSMSASPKCALAMAAMSADSVPICAQSIFAFSMFAVVICASAMVARSA